MKWKFWKKEPVRSRHMNCKRILPEEDTNAHVQNREELEFNITNPLYEKRIEKAKNNAMSRMSEDKKVDLLFRLHIDESLKEQFDYINKKDEK